MSIEGSPRIIESTSIKILASSHKNLIICPIINLTLSFVLTQKKQKFKAVPTQPKITTQNLNLTQITH